MFRCEIFINEKLWTTYSYTEIYAEVLRDLKNKRLEFEDKSMKFVIWSVTDKNFKNMPLPFTKLNPKRLP